MRLRLLIHTCSNENVARAALLSIGGDLAARVVAEAGRRSHPVDAFVAQALTHFERSSDLPIWGQAEVAARGADQPVLAAPYFILDRALGRAGFAEGAPTTPASDALNLAA